jgi:DNA-binding SARP family transcriptional activator
MRLRTFGGLVLEGSGFTRPKLLLLLSYLALEGPQDRRHLAELFWPEAADHLKSLTVALVRLRQGAPGVIAADHERVWATVETDAETFLTLLEKVS